jgi:hypothetical protein
MANYRHRSAADQYLRQYPHLHQWLNVCRGCGARGFKPDLPDNIYPWFNVAADHLRAFFRPLGLNEIGLCEQCAEAAFSLETRAREKDRA